MKYFVEFHLLSFRTTIYDFVLETKKMFNFLPRINSATIG